MAMKQGEISKVYQASSIEDAIYKTWEESGFFNPDKLPGQRKKSFSIAMPPPNATGTLHLGHAVMLAIQDLVIRYQRMSGAKALWLPGTDHAAIATNAKVEKILKETVNKTRFDLGREAFVQRVNDFIIESQNTITNQVRKMGSSCDWSRQRYTLDAGLSNAVATAFVEMYHDGLIYRGERIVNWCPHCASTLADDEVEYQEEQTPFYYFKYGPVVIGTARPETKFGDKVIIVHPNDSRYQALVGQELEVDWILGKIKARVIADEATEIDMGSGAMTITPGHSFIDFELAQKYGIPIEKIIDEQGKLTAAAGTLAGLDVKTARQKVVEILQSKNLVDHIDENYTHNLSVCYRCGTAVEPLVSKQWFVNVNAPVKKFKGQSLKERSLAVVRNNEIKIIPERFEKTYFHWMENLRDWCISRQIWFGHRIPVWYRNGKAQIANGKSSEEIYVGVSKPTGEGWTQDPDTLDTWFSSGLWTFSTLGWPEQTVDLKTFHPTSLMETGYDILFFWIARMILMTTYLIEDIPFETVYLHGLVRDEQGRKMSKSLENTINPLDTIAKYGADATRLSLIIGTTPGNDVNLGEAKIAGYRNFVNKLWNISRYILMTVENPQTLDQRPQPKTLADAWILAELDLLIVTATDNLDKYNFSAVGEKIYEFTWSKLADWYVEVAKIEKEKDEILCYVLTQLLKLWHPFTPFVTEAIWQELNPAELLIVAAWPQTSAKVDKNVLNDFGLVKDVITAIRNLRSESKIAAGKKIKAIIISKQAKILTPQAEIIKSLARLQDLEIVETGDQPSQALSAVVGGTEIYLPVSDMIDIEQETKRLTAEAQQLNNYLESLNKKLSNKDFVKRAPAEVVKAEMAKLEASREQLAKISEQLKTLT
ncbi:MAG: valine--tRNA ligase [Patescibacteria group bacterium]|nr:valine--tRNA ligase [Patescibacteria group bacterium]